MAGRGMRGERKERREEGEGEMKKREKAAAEEWRRLSAMIERRVRRRRWRRLSGWRR